MEFSNLNARELKGELMWQKLQAEGQDNQSEAAKFALSQRLKSSSVFSISPTALLPPAHNTEDRWSSADNLTNSSYPFYGAGALLPSAASVYKPKCG